MLSLLFEHDVLLLLVVYGVSLLSILLFVHVVDVGGVAYLGCSCYFGVLQIFVVFIGGCLRCVVGGYVLLKA